MPLIGAVIAWIVAKITAKSFFLGIQIAVSISLIAGHIILVGFFFYAILFVYNKYNELLNYISTMSTQSDLLSVALSIMQAMGLINAFNDVFAIFSPFIIGYLAYRVSMVVFSAYEKTSNEVFKVGVLVQQ